MVPKDAGYPVVIEFGGLGPCYYSLETYRIPRKGEYYIDGGNPLRAVRARHTLREAHRVVRPTFVALPGNRMGPAVTLTDPEEPMRVYVTVKRYTYEEAGLCR